MRWADGNPAQRPVAPDVRRVVARQALWAHPDVARSLKGLCRGEPLPCKAIWQDVVASEVGPVGEGQPADRVSRDAGATRERRDHERIGLAPPLRIGRVRHFLIAEQQRLGRYAERRSVAQQPGCERLAGNRCGERRQGRRADLTWLDQLNRKQLNRHAAAPQEA